MGRKKSNPELVKELIDNLWNINYSQEEFEEKYSSLNSSDMSKVSAAIGRMDKQAEKELLKDCLW